MHEKHECLRKVSPEAFVQGEDEDLLGFAQKLQAKLRLPRQAPGAGLQARVSSQRHHSMPRATSSSLETATGS